MITALFRHAIFQFTFALYVLLGTWENWEQFFIALFPISIISFKNIKRFINVKTGPAACRKRFANISLITDPISFLIQEANKNC